MESDKTLGQELKNARETRKMSLREVQDITGISNAYLSQLEHDKVKKPSANILYKLSQVYKMDFDLLMAVAGIIESTDQKEGPKSLSGFALSSDELTQDEQEALAEYLKFLRFQKKKDDK